MRRTVLPGGLRVVTERVPWARSAALGIWFDVGARDERPGLAGASHFVEHLLFKGTRRRSALEIAATLDAVGGELNAFTDHEQTCVHTQVLAEDLPLALDVVCDMVTSSRLASADVENERGVVLEEIAGDEDDPEQVAYQAFAETLFGDGPLGRPITGTTASVEGLTRSALAGWYRRRYTPAVAVVAVAGQLEHDEVVELVVRGFGDRLDGPAQPAPPRPQRGQVAAREARVERTRAIEQASVVLGTVGLSVVDARGPALRVLDTALGGGMSSRLFQQVREERGLAYSVYSSADAYADTGTFTVYAGCAPSAVEQVLDVCRQVLEDVARDGLTEEEVARARGQLRGATLLDLEDTAARASRLGYTELSHGRYREVEEVLAELAAVTPSAVQEVAREVLRRPMTVAVVGPAAGGGTGEGNEEEVA